MMAENSLAASIGITAACYGAPIFAVFCFLAIAEQLVEQSLAGLDDLISEPVNWEKKIKAKPKKQRSKG